MLVGTVLLALMLPIPVGAQNVSVPANVTSGPDWQARHSGQAAMRAPLDIWHRDTLTGDWSGVRSALSDKGVTFTLTYTADLQGNLQGGIRRGGVYDGVLQPQVDVDLDKLLGWNGASMRVSALQITGPSLSADYVGNLLNVSSINARPATRLYNAWLQQNAFDDLLSVRMGLMTADSEFFVSPTAGLFINTSFGWPGILVVDLPGGGPAYPLSAPGVRVKLQPTPEFSLMAAMFSGDPTGNDGANSLSTQQPSGTVISFNGGIFLMAEAGYAVNQDTDAKGLPASFKLGGWYHTSTRFGDQRFDTHGRSLADPLSDGMPLLHSGDWGLYGIVDATVYREPGTEDQGLSVFARMTGSPEDQNLISLYADGGLAYKGLLPGRDNDKVGVAVAYARISSRARDLDLDYRTFGNLSHPIRSAELALELSYQAQVTLWWTLQADVQFVANPSGGVQNADGGVRANALVLGLRSALTF